MGLATSAQAIPIGGLPAGIVGNIVDNPFDITVTLNGGEVTDDTDTLMPLTPNPLGNWPITISINKENRDNDTTPAPDFVIVSGNVFHDFDPHAGEDNGDAINFGYTFLPPANPRINIDGVGADFQNIQMVNHEIHNDRYRLTALYTFIGNNILNWSLTLNGRHPRAVPEPSTLSLAVLPAAAVFGSALWRRRRHIRQ